MGQLFYAYVLRSASTGRLYKGSSGQLPARVDQHNDPEYRHNRYTYKQKGPWELVYYETFETRAEARRREDFFKSGQGREWLKQTLDTKSSVGPPEAD